MSATRPALDHCIVRILGRTPAISAALLYERIVRDYRPCSLQGVYHVLRTLQHRGTVVKSGESFSLSLLWTLDLVQFAEDAYRACVASAVQSSLLPAPGGRKRWRFNRAAHLDALYVQLTLLLIKRTDERTVWEWCPHPWFMLAQQEFEERFKRALEKSRKDIYCVIGGRTPLDRQWVRSRASPALHYGIARSPFEKRRRDYFTVVGPYILTARLSKNLAGEIDALFERAPTLQQIDYPRFLGLLGARQRLTLTLEHNQAEAAKLNARFLRYYRTLGSKR